MDLDRLKHSYSVAKKMQEIAKEKQLDQSQINDLFILGLNHDIGYEYAPNGEDHNKIGGNILKSNGYKYWKEVYYHGEIDIKYSSLFLDILNMADMQIDKFGNDVGYENRLLDIKNRYGDTSIVYNKCETLINDLRRKQ